MKKFIAISLTIILIICSSTVSWAATTITGNGGSDNQNVKATFDLTGTTATYSVNISWGALTYEPNTTLTGAWNAAGYYTVTGSDGAWKPTNDGTTNVVTVTNNSNVNIKANFSYTIDPDFKTDYFSTTGGSDAAKFTFTAGSGGTFADNALTLGSAVTSGDLTGSVKVGVTATIDRSPQKTVTDLILGYVTVIINSAA